jgi:putative flippase GtrA
MTRSPAGSPTASPSGLPLASPKRSVATTVDIVVPVYNEEQILASSIERLRDHLVEGFPFDWRIVIADNASTDATADVGRALAADDQRITLLHLDQKGRGRALRAAWSRSDADVVAYTDVDLSTGLTGLLPLVAPLVSGHSDLAIGSRLSATSVVARGPKREFISRCYNQLLRLVFAVRFRDAQCGFKAGRADIVKLLLPAVVDEAWFFDTELLLLAEYNGLRVHEVPVDWIDDPDSRVDVRSTAMEDLRGVRRMAWRFARGKGSVDLGVHERQPLADDFGRQTVTFASIGVVSTVISLVIFLLLRDQIGAVWANVVGFTATAIGNNWANRRWTFRRRSDEDRRWRMVTTFAVFAISLLVTSLALAAVDGNPTAELVVLALTWTAAAIFRFVVLRAWVYRR